MSLKSNIYKILRILNDINSMKKGTYGKRMERRIDKKVTRKAIKKLFK